MGARNPESKNVKFYSLKAKVDATNDPFFSLTEKVNDSWQQTATFNEMFGIITKAEILEREFEGKKSNYFRFQLTDENEVSYVDMTHNGITYSILNSLASDFDTTKEISIRVYKKEQEKDGKTYYNGKAYVAAEGDPLSWAVEIKDAPRPELVTKADGSPVIVNGSKVYDKEGVVSFWEELFNSKIKNKFSSDSVKQDSENKEEQPKKEEKPQSKKVEQPIVDDEEDDLPF